MVKIQWITSHIIPVNDAADLLEKLACSSSSITDLNLELEEYCSVLKSSLNQLKFNLWNYNKNDLSFGKILQVDNVWNWKWISTGVKKIDIVLVRFRSGCVGVRKYLFKIGCADSPYYTDIISWKI